MKNIIAGNWKMNHSLESIHQFFNELKPTGEAWIAPQALHLAFCLEFKNQHPKLRIGAQNCAHQTQGAFTGEISPLALKEMGIDFVILGHSERREQFFESDELINNKVILALETGLRVIFCVGETLQQRESGITQQVIQQQVTNGLKDIPENLVSSLVIAYEPVWAIGTGLTASPEQAQEVHSYIRRLTTELFAAQASSLPILYGGSVKPSNLAELLEKPDINGGLVGGASLKASDFTELLKIQACQD
jgi:triosephosphate isomerase (TIM)